MRTLEKTDENSGEVSPTLKWEALTVVEERALYRLTFLFYPHLGGYSFFSLLICLIVIVTLIMLVIVDSSFKKQRWVLSCFVSLASYQLILFFSLSPFSDFPYLTEIFFSSHSSNQDVFSISHPAFPTGAKTQDPRNSGHQLCLAQESWIKNRLLKKWKDRLNQL